MSDLSAQDRREDRLISENRELLANILEVEKERDDWKTTAKSQDNEHAETLVKLAKAEGELREINGCVDWGAISAGRATTISEVRRTIVALKTAMGEKGNLTVEVQSLKDRLEAMRTILQEAVNALKFIYNEGNGREVFPPTTEHHGEDFLRLEKSLCKIITDFYGAIPTQPTPEPAGQEGAR